MVAVVCLADAGLVAWSAPAPPIAPDPQQKADEQAKDKAKDEEEEPQSEADKAKQQEFEPRPPTNSLR